MCVWQYKSTQFGNEKYRIGGYIRSQLSSSMDDVATFAGGDGKQRA